MRIEELSIGDWVKWNGKPRKIEQIGYEGEMFVKVGVCYYCSIEECSPIPLTPEILEKNGLMRVSEEKCYEAYCCNDFLIRRSKFSCTDWWQVDVHYKQYVAHLSGYIQYVHQLQHLLTINECDKKIEL